MDDPLFSSLDIPYCIAMIMITMKIMDFFREITNQQKRRVLFQAGTTDGVSQHHKPNLWQAELETSTSRIPDSTVTFEWIILNYLKPQKYTETYFRLVLILYRIACSVF